MSNQKDETKLQANGDFEPSARPAANVGKRFYTWATLGTFAGASFLVSGIWALMRRLNSTLFSGEEWALLLSVIVIVAFAFASEPEQQTSWNQKIQKGLVTLGNVLLVYFSVLGATTIVTQVVGAGS